jgi:hypothetical protein
LFTCFILGVGKLAGHVVVEMTDIDNRELITLCAADKIKVSTVVAHDMIGRLMIQVREWVNYLER